MNPKHINDIITVDNNVKVLIVTEVRLEMGKRENVDNKQGKNVDNKQGKLF